IHRLFVLGVMATIGLQASINLLVVTGLAPTKGIALPLVSKGGTGWILTCFALGLVCAIDRARERSPAVEHEDEHEFPSETLLA
ncbi:MAG: FtsW/RodA/SpoVE family cell cycle protein, partial [Planctomycetota bacterium]